MTTATARTASDVLEILADVDDPEYPGVSIVDLGLVEAVRVDAGGAQVDLIPTFLGCPALEFIAADVRSALEAAGFHDAMVRFVDRPVWTADRITDVARRRLASELAVAVAVRRGHSPPACPHCGATALNETSLFGSMRCRSISECQACGEPVETIR